MLLGHLPREFCRVFTEENCPLLKKEKEKRTTQHSHDWLSKYLCLFPCVRWGSDMLRSKRVFMHQLEYRGHVGSTRICMHAEVQYTTSVMPNSSIHWWMLLASGHNCLIFNQELYIEDADKLIVYKYVKLCENRQGSVVLHIRLYR